MIGYVHSFENFGNVDGPGTRFVVFMQGCIMRCKYCHNRDTWNFSKDKSFTVDEIFSEYSKYKTYYTKGGITVTGGEPLCQLEFIDELFTMFKKNSIHTCLDTSGITYTNDKKSEYIKLLKNIDLVLLDLKHIDNKEHIDLTGLPNKSVFDFLGLLNEVEVDTVIRYVVVPGLNDSDEYALMFKDFVSRFTNVIGIDVLPFHKMGEYKWDELEGSAPFAEKESTSEETVDRIKKILSSKNI